MRQGKHSSCYSRFKIVATNGIAGTIASARPLFSPKPGPMITAMPPLTPHPKLKKKQTSKTQHSKLTSRQF